MNINFVDVTIGCRTERVKILCPNSSLNPQLQRDFNDDFSDDFGPGLFSEIAKKVQKWQTSRI